MNTQANTNLLKEYIKTLVATEVDFPGILPRQWGNEFSRSELVAIHFTLKFVLETDKLKTGAVLLREFKNVNYTAMNLHWFLCDFWPEIVPLLTVYNATQVKYPNSTKPSYGRALSVSNNQVLAS
ncbi:hypothetical protein GO755_00660 [Spirosoma sp. HMF4905]|uniref:Uncharacterized protein n=1 Tax=Spirosoma arboris TaxID=2682092 RepID=A0A7K1S3X2_9BACT|nr:hypothetical protein [Spirosoma arboris]MVM28522.1 hypothetical protein [Spirosoma arboris]